MIIVKVMDPTVENLHTDTPVRLVLSTITLDVSEAKNGAIIRCPDGMTMIIPEAANAFRVTTRRIGDL